MYLLKWTVSTLVLSFVLSAHALDKAPGKQPESIFLGEAATAAKAEQADLIRAIGKRGPEGDILRKRIGELDQRMMGRLVSGKSKLFRFNAFDGVDITIEVVEVEHYKSSGSYVIRGRLKSDLYPESEIDSLPASVADDKTRAALKRGLLGFKLYISEWSKDKKTGKAFRSSYHPTNPTVGVRHLKRSSRKNYSTFYSIHADIMPAFSDDFYNIRVVDDDPEYQIIHHRSKRLGRKDLIINDDRGTVLEALKKHDPEAYEERINSEWYKRNVEAK